MTGDTERDISRISESLGFIRIALDRSAAALDRLAPDPDAPVKEETVEEREDFRKRIEAYRPGVMRKVKQDIEDAEGR